MTTTYYQLTGSILDTNIDEHYWQFDNAADRARSIAKAANYFYNYGQMQDTSSERFTVEIMTAKQLDFNPKRLALVRDGANEDNDVLQIIKVEVDIFDTPKTAVDYLANALHRAEDFIEGFRDDPAQEGVTDLLKQIRDALVKAGHAPSTEEMASLNGEAS